MTGAHLTDERAASYVIGALPSDEACAVEAHVADCDPCAQKLAEEARLELAMELVARSSKAADAAPVPMTSAARRLPSPPPRKARPPVFSRRPLGRGAAISSALAMAAVMLLGVGRASSDTIVEPAAQGAPSIALDGDVNPLEAIDGG